MRPKRSQSLEKKIEFFEIWITLRGVNFSVRYVFEQKIESRAGP